MSGRNWRLAVALCCCGVAFAFAAFIIVSGKIFWDFSVYRAGVRAFQAGANPYDVGYLSAHYGVNLQFIYPPLALLGFAAAAWLFTSPVGNSLLLLLHAFAFIAIPILLVPRALRRTELAWISGVYLVAFGLSGAKLFLSGNVAALLCFAIVGTLRYGAARHNYVALWIALLLICQIKIYFIAFLAVPFWLERDIFKTAAAALLILGSCTANYFVSPELFHQFATSLAASSQSSAFVGTSVLSAAQIALSRLPGAQTLPVMPLAFAIHCIYSLGVVAFGAVVLWPRVKGGAAAGPQPDLVFAWTLMGACLISPRLLPYDLALLVVPFVVLLRHLLLNPGTGLYVAAGAGVISVSLVLTPLADWAALSASLGVWSGIGVLWHWQERSRAPVAPALSAMPQT